MPDALCESERDLCFPRMISEFLESLPASRLTQFPLDPRVQMFALLATLNGKT